MTTDQIYWIQRVITWQQTFSMVYGDEIELKANATSTDQLTYTSSDPSIIKIDGSKAKAVGVGTVTLSAIAEENANHIQAVFTKEVLVVNYSEEISIIKTGGLPKLWVF